MLGLFREGLLVNNPSKVFSAESFWPKFNNDLRNAKLRVILQSPFLTARRLSIIRPALAELVQKEVPICVFVQAPRRKFADKKPTSEEVESIRTFQDCVKELESLDVHVTVRPDIHEKLAIIDENVLWEGSLNILSHSRTSERMRRIESAEEVTAAIEQHNLQSCLKCLRPRTIHPPTLIEQFIMIRQARDLSQTDLANICGIERSSISRLEAQRHDPRLSLLLRVAKGLDREFVLVPCPLLHPVLTILGKYKLTQMRDGIVSEPDWSMLDLTVTSARNVE